ncbi:MAG: ferredoxin [Acidobacteriota bacterium]|jgi:ferredoxin
MADKELAVPENVPGKWYVEDTCIACDSCTSIAPDHFVYTDDGEYAYVHKQPENEEEEQACLDAMESCPSESIKNDG